MAQGYIWFDYFSVPQLNAGNDVAGLDADLFVSSSNKVELGSANDSKSTPTHRRDKTLPNFYSSEKDAEKVSSMQAYEVLSYCNVINLCAESSSSQ